VPNGVNVVGLGSDNSWLQGKLLFGSNSRISGLKIGDYGVAAVHNVNGATNTVFEGCRFRGGGGNSYTYVVDLGMHARASNISFIGCQVERNLGSEDGSFSRGFNNVTIWSGTDSAVTDILFEGCHVGVSNGVATGSPRMGLECYTDSGSGWQRVTIRGCTFEVTDCHALDFSDEPNSRSRGVLIEGCLIKGAGLARRLYGCCIDFEYPQGAVVRNNTIYRAWEHAIQMTDRGDSRYTPAQATFTGNTIDVTVDNGVITAGYNQVKLHGTGNVWENNTIIGQTQEPWTVAAP
jgi:hypothetical protein